MCMCLSVCGCMYAMMNTWRPEDNFWELGLIFRYVGFGGPTGLCVLYLLNHLRPGHFEQLESSPVIYCLPCFFLCSFVSFQFSRVS